MEAEKRVQFNPMDVSLGDIEDLENGLGVKFGRLLGSFRGQGEVDINDLDYRTMAAMCFLVKRREDPEFSLEDVRTMTFGDMVEFMGDRAVATPVADVKDPTPAG